MDRSDAKTGLQGAVEGVKAKAKEVAGVITGNDETIEEGRDEPKTAAAKRDAAKHEAQAEKDRTEARVRESS